MPSVKVLHAHPRFIEVLVRFCQIQYFNSLTFQSITLENILAFSGDRQKFKADNAAPKVCSFLSAKNIAKKE